MSQYWKNRESEALKQNKLTEEQYKAEVEKIYNCMLRDIQREIDSFYGRYATKEGITIAEAKKRVAKLDMDDYERKAKQYVKDRDFSDLANDEMRLYNLTMKVNRLEMLKSRIGLELLAGHDDLEKFMKGILKGRTMEELERQAGILGESVIKSKDLDKMVSSIVNASFHNANFSQRIWTNEAVMKAELDKLLKQGLIQGKSARDLARSLRTLCGAFQRNAERLMITELARVQIEAQKLSYLENDFEEYEYIAEPTACPICKVLDGKHFKVAKMLPGENAAPMHPHCRCSTAPYSDRKEFDEWLNYLEKGGTAEQWDRLRNETSHSLAVRDGNIYGIDTKYAENIDKKLIVDIDKFLHRAFKKHPEMRNFIDRIEFDDTLTESEIAKAVINRQLKVSLKLNKNLFMNKNALNRLLLNCPKDFTLKKNIYDYLEHEFTHLREWNHAIMENTKNGVVDADKAYRDISSDKFSKEIVEDACKSCELPNNSGIIKEYISGYGSTWYSEAVAEALSGGDSRLCIEIQRLVEKRWK